MATDKGLEDVPEGESCPQYIPLPASYCRDLRRPPFPHRHLSLAQLDHPLNVQPANHFLNDTGQIESNYDETVDSFDDMNLKSELLRGKGSLG